jgi:thiamine biosynthesis lipoprotein
VLVNAGGDLLHRGGDPITVGIEDPRRPFDNVAPLARVALADGGLASSSGARRPLRVGTMVFSHVLDPRTGWPVEHTLAATTIATDAATADAATTVVGVLAVGEALAFADATAGLACHLLDRDGAQHTSGRWPGEHDSGDRPQASAR